MRQVLLAHDLTRYAATCDARIASTGQWAFRNTLSVTLPSHIFSTAGEAHHEAGLDSVAVCLNSVYMLLYTGCSTLELL